MTTPEPQDPNAPPDRVEQRGPYVLSGVASYLPDVQRWAPRIGITRSDGKALEFVVPCGPECYRKNADEALNAGWAAARQWLDGGRIPWKAAPGPAAPASATPPTAGFADAAAMWDKRFSDDGFLFGREPNAYLQAQAALLPARGRVLCVADGEGRNSVWLAGRGLTVEAFDISAVGVAKARRLAAEAGVAVDYTVGDCDAWPWAPASHDAVVAIFVQFADPAMRARLFANMVRALKPGGVLVLQGYTPRQIEYKTGGPGERSHLYTAELIRDAFAALQTLELLDYEAELDEGARHSGRSALLGYVGRKKP